MSFLDLRHLTKRRNRRRMPWHKVKRQIWHRTHMDYDDSPEAYVEVWKNRSLGTGGKVPYHCVVKRDGDIWWLVPWNRIAPGAAPYNSTSYNIAVEQDLRRFPPSMKQWGACKWLVKLLAWEHGVTELHGHTDLVPSKTKVCPGRFLDIHILKRIAESQDAE